ncbi:hypothetical protein TOPH_06532 [Tolypocladium ophioglossoides CBS 100239]|uniref:Uncharacterized protein n=1 Tax=Tolypocladium ophioglossoides (strain CBS 100239) TaxID=1163406 RepID=A0A0L0N3X4_TOLOC|nr:hypothetical protein TOPH_06532 [Tolypocladium ophioglossoides CBS 100239]
MWRFLSPTNRALRSRRQPGSTADTHPQRRGVALAELRLTSGRQATFPIYRSMQGFLTFSDVFLRQGVHTQSPFCTIEHLFFFWPSPRFAVGWSRALQVTTNAWVLRPARGLEGASDHVRLM